MRKKKAKLSLNYHAHDELSLTKIKLWQKRECHYNEIVKVIEFTIYKNNLQGDSLVISIKWMKDMLEQISFNLWYYKLQRNTGY